MSSHIGGKINRVSTKIKRKCCNIESIKVLNEISGTNGMIVGYINKCNERGIDVFQKDIEHEFGITRSTASKVISLMEKKDLIIRVESSLDLRLKKLVLTKKAKALSDSCRDDLLSFDKSLLKGFTSEEEELLLSFLDRIEKNIESKEE